MYQAQQIEDTDYDQQHTKNNTAGSGRLTILVPAYNEAGSIADFMMEAMFSELILKKTFNTYEKGH